MSARLLAAAKVYAFNYCQDEAEDEEDCVCGAKQHAEAKELFAAIKEAEEMFRAPSTAALLPCPFCWSAAKRTGGYAAGITIRTARCSNDDCLASFKSVDDEIWNRRAPSHAASTEPVANFTATQAAQLTEQDAARYRWLRNKHNGGDEQWFVYGAQSPVTLDESIDAAILASQSEKGEGA